MRVLDHRFANDIKDAVIEVLFDLGMEQPEEAIPGLMLVVRNRLEQLDWDMQGQALDEAMGLLEDDHEENLLS